MLSIWYKLNVAAGATAVTVSGVSGPTRGAIAEYFELSLPGRLEGTSCNQGVATAVSSGATVTVSAGALVFGAVANSDKSGSQTVTPGSIHRAPANLRLQTTGPDGTIAVEDVTKGTAGVQDATMTVTHGVWHSCVAVFGP